MDKNNAKVKQVGGMETFTYAFYFVGQNIIYWLVTNYLLFFYTDYAKITPAAVTLIFLIAKVWDAINDPIFGMIVDKTSFKKAKFTPWIKISSFLLPLSTVLIFTIPSDFSMGWKIFLAFITYALWDILYTVSDVPVFALSTVMTTNITERTTLVTFGRVGAMVGALLINLIAPILVEKNGILLPVIGFATIAIITMLPVGFIAKERGLNKKKEELGVSNLNKNNGELDVSNESQPEEHSFKEMFAYLKGNKYLLFFFGSFLIHGIFKVTLSNHVAKHLLGNLTINSLVGLVTMPFMFVVYIILPILTKRYDRMTIYKASIIASVAVGFVQYFAGYQNIVLFILMNVARVFAEGLAGLLMFTFSGDALEYGHYKTGIRKEGITFSLQTFSAKFTAAIASVITALMLTIIGYEGGEAVTSTMKTWIWAANCFLPSLGALLSLSLLMKYDLKVKDVQIMADINSGAISREEGDTLLSRSY